MLIVQVPVPEFIVILIVGVAPVHGWRSISDQLLRWVDYCTVARAQERRH